MTLSKAFAKAKWYGGVVKDTLVNMGDAMLAGQEIVGSAEAGMECDVAQVNAASKARCAARRDTRNLLKPQ